MKTKNKKQKIKNILTLICIFGFWILGFDFTDAALLYLEPSGGEYSQDDTFIVEARIDPEGECINAVKADLNFAKDVLEAVDFSQGNSILVIWLEGPKINRESGLISFSGGVPGGYCGPLPGEPGKPGLLGRIIFQAKEIDEKRIAAAEIKFLESSQVLLNDGFGTPAKLTVRGAFFKIAGVRPLQTSKDEWQEELKKDDIMPEPFKIEVQKDPSLFEGKYFIVFSASDKQTGIDYYEVHEAPPIWTLKTTKPKKAESPYLLEDQTLRSIIKVKAVDKAGNERLAEYLPPKKPVNYWIIIIILIAGGIIYWLWQKYTKQ